MDEQITQAESNVETEVELSLRDENSDVTAEQDTKELELLREQVKKLTAELDENTKRSQRIASELGEFYELFPNADIKSLPNEVWEGVKNGTSLAAALALYNHRVSLREARVKEINSRNSSLSTGKISSGGASEYFTPDEVRAMSRSEIRANYNKIVESMKRWN